jgi:hypothetical protein
MFHPGINSHPARSDRFGQPIKVYPFSIHDGSDHDAKGIIAHSACLKQGPRCHSGLR